MSIQDTVRIKGRTFRSLFDAATRTTTSTTPVGRQSLSRIDAQGRLVMEEAPGVDSVTYGYDAFGRVTEIRQGTRVWSYAYGADGLLASATDPLLRTTEFSYDANGRLTEQLLPGNRQAGFGYDANGNLTSVVPPGRPAHTFSYNAVNLATE